jgi:Aminoglycoside-2''-adenylyltransferase
MSGFEIRYSAAYPVHAIDDDVDFYRRYGPWASVRPGQVLEVLGDFARPWWIAGGWAIDAFTRTARPHEDIDVSIFRKDVPELRRALDKRFHLWSAGGGLRPVDDRWPEPHPDADQIWVREHALAPWLVDVVLNGDRDGAWISRRDPAFVRPLDEVTWAANDGVCYLLPELVLIFKARLARSKDDVDFERAWPLLDGRQRAMLREYLLRELPGHRWLAGTC